MKNKSVIVYHFYTKWGGVLIMAVGKDKTTKKWYSKFRYHDFTGKSIQKRKIGFKTRKEAMKWEEDFIAMHEGQERIIFKHAYEKYINDCETRLKKGTVFIKKIIRKHYTPLDDMALADITPSIIRAFQNKYMLKTDDNGKLVYTKKTIQCQNNHLSAFFTWACKLCGLAINPVKAAGTITIRDTAKKPEVIKNIWQLADFQRFIESVERPDYHLIYSLLFFCGLRRGEALGLRVKDVDLENGVLHIKQNKTTLGIDTPKTKTSKRTVSLPNNIVIELRQYIGKKYKPSTTELLFTMSPDRVSDYFREKQKKLGMTPRIRLHDLRHSHASMLINLGFSPDVVADRLGHSNASMVLNIYGHMYPSKRIEVVDALNKAVEEDNKLNS